MRGHIGHRNMTRPYVQYDGGASGGVSLTEPARSAAPVAASRRQADGPRPEGMRFASLPGGAGRRSSRSRANGFGTEIRVHEKETTLTAGFAHHHDLALRAVRQHGSGRCRGLAGQHAGSAIRQPRDKKTPGAPTPSVPESCWDVWTPEIDPAVAKR